MPSIETIPASFFVRTPHMHHTPWRLPARVAIASGPLFRRSRSPVAATYRSNSMSVVTLFKSMATAADTFVSGEARLQAGGFPALRERDQRPFELVVVGGIRQDF